jgi:hypothetical protein
LSSLAADPHGILSECADSGEPLVVELPDHRLVSIQGLEPDEDDDLIDRLLASNPSFRALVEKSKASPRRPFPGQAESRSARTAD